MSTEFDNFYLINKDEAQCLGCCYLWFCCVSPDEFWAVMSKRRFGDVLQNLQQQPSQSNRAGSGRVTTMYRALPGNSGRDSGPENMEVMGTVEEQSQRRSGRGVSSTRTT